jgi:hypothetical protein
MAKSVINFDINFDIVNCVLLVVILIIVIICCMKKEHYEEPGIPDCSSANPCSKYTKRTPEHISCSQNKWRKCAPIDGSKFCNARQIQAEKSTEQMKVCDTNERGWKWLYPDPLPPN